jgi:hypothetical protein
MRPLTRVAKTIAETTAPLAEPSVTTSLKGRAKPRMTTPHCNAPRDSREASLRGAGPTVKARKKLSYLASAIAASFGANAYADVSVSGSGTVGYVNDTSGDGNVVTGSSVDFGLSTTTANGISISTGLSITVSVTAENGASTGGGQSLTFATGGATIVVGDISVADTPGSVGGVAGSMTVENAGFDSDVQTAFDDDDGTGISLSTAVGGATVSVAYVFDDDSDSQVNVTDADTGASSFGISMPMGAYTLSAGVADHDSGESAAGASVSAAIGGGTLTIGYSSQTMIADPVAGATTGFVTTFISAATPAGTVSVGADVTVTATTNTASADDLTTPGDTEVIGATYAMALDADTSISVGYQSAKDADSDSTTQFDLAISRSLGGGASVYVDMRTLSGDTDGANGDGTAFGFGTSVAF